MALSMSAQNYVSRRPAAENRLFTSEIVESKIQEVASQLTNPKLAWPYIPYTVADPELKKMIAGTILRQAAEILLRVNNNEELAKECTRLADED